MKGSVLWAQLQLIYMIVNGRPTNRYTFWLKLNGFIEHNVSNGL